MKIREKQLDAKQKWKLSFLQARILSRNYFRGNEVEYLAFILHTRRGHFAKAEVEIETWPRTKRNAGLNKEVCEKKTPIS